MGRIILLAILIPVGMVADNAMPATVAPEALAVERDIAADQTKGEAPKTRLFCS